MFAGDQYRLFVTIEGRGVSIRLKGSVKPDPNTGQVTAVFKDNPELLTRLTDSVETAISPDPFTASSAFDSKLTSAPTIDHGSTLTKNPSSSSPLRRRRPKRCRPTGAARWRRRGLPR